jgi:hypothetical protein
MNEDDFYKEEKPKKERREIRITRSLSLVKDNMLHSYTDQQINLLSFSEVRANSPVKINWGRPRSIERCL